MEFIFKNWYASPKNLEPFLWLDPCFQLACRSNSLFLLLHCKPQVTQILLQYVIFNRYYIIWEQIPEKALVMCASTWQGKVSMSMTTVNPDTNSIRIQGFDDQKMKEKECSWNFFYFCGSYLPSWIRIHAQRCLFISVQSIWILFGDTEL